MSGARVTPGREIKRRRRRRAHSCWDHLIIAPLAVPKLPWVPEALDKGNTLRRPACVHWTGRDPVAWLGWHREQGSRIGGVELADEAIRLADLTAARQRTVIVLGHEHDGIPDDAMQLVDVAVEIPMNRHRGQPQRGRRGLARPVPAGRVPVARNSLETLSPAWVAGGPA